MQSLAISPLQYAVALSLLLTRCVAISSLSPLDLLAYPAYSVQLRPDRPISNTSAERILARGGHDENLEHEQKNAVNELQVQSGGEVGAAAVIYNAFLLRSSGNGQGYLCEVPQQQQRSEDIKGGQEAEQKVQLTSDEWAERNRRAEEEKRQAYEKGLALLEPLKGTCLYLTQGWFTCEWYSKVIDMIANLSNSSDAFCHGSEIRQFHAIPINNPNGPHLAEDHTQDSYTLGQFTNRVIADEGLVDTKKARALGSLREILDSDDKENAQNVGNKLSQNSWEASQIGDQKRYLVQRWTGGTLCDKTGVDRRVEVQVSICAFTMELKVESFAILSFTAIRNHRTASF